MAKEYKNLTPEEKLAAFEKWNENRETRKVGSKAKRSASKQLVEKYQAEYNKLLAAAGGKPKSK